jgi:hypothetical protein
MVLTPSSQGATGLNCPVAFCSARGTTHHGKQTDVPESSCLTFGSGPCESSAIRRLRSRYVWLAVHRTGAPCSVRGATEPSLPPSGAPSGFGMVRIVAGDLPVSLFTSAQGPSPEARGARLFAGEPVHHPTVPLSPSALSKRGMARLIVGDSVYCPTIAAFPLSPLTRFPSRAVSVSGGLPSRSPRGHSKVNRVPKVALKQVTRGTPGGLGPTSNAGFFPSRCPGSGENSAQR